LALAFTRLYFDKAIAAFNHYKINMTFSKIKLFGLLALSYSLIACGQTPVSNASNATPNAIAQTTTAPQTTETPAVVAKSPEPQPSVTQVPEKSPEPQPSAVASPEVNTAIAQSQDDSTKTTIAQQTTEPIGGGMQMGILYRVYILLFPLSMSLSKKPTLAKFT
jgi:uncharacterized membrane protein